METTTKFKQRGRYMKHNEDDITNAITNIKNKTMSFRKAALLYGIPIATLHDRIKHEEIKPRGAKPKLNKEEEGELVNWLMLSAEKGEPRTTSEIMKGARDVLALRNDPTTFFKNGLPTTRWVHRFKQRNPTITYRKPENLSKASANVSLNEVENQYNSFYEYLEKNNLLYLTELSDRWINLDEKSYLLSPTPKKVYAKKGAKNVYKVDHANSKESITVTHSFRADGAVLPSQVIFKSSFSRMGDVASACGEIGAFFLFAQSDSGWQNKDTFLNYIKRINDILKDSPRPIIITCDNHASHKNYELFKYCSENGIILWTLPPNTTHVCQMADVAMYRPANICWEKKVREYKVYNKIDKIDEVAFVKILFAVENETFLPQLIKKGFEVTGVFPFNVKSIHADRLLGTSKQQQQQTMHTIDENQNLLVIGDDEYFVEALDDAFIDFNNINKTAQAEIAPKPTIRDVLPYPKDYVKTGGRKYKVKNSGVMTAPEILEDYGKIKEEKLAKLREQEKKKKDREEKKALINEQILIKTNRKRIKNESPEEILQVVTPKRGRGRPKKDRV
ncbi:hypothetical protein PVAND_003456 [Polypedilum vanderplanki]|uniref:HTH CENPB-type domain-containing protein n=1 Tax=Polypedilum vanderplanki TaxID=319348 RepID=A0A9J6BU35_POLVA|nr:hypothetical protein PVAND_003456 [Polypedilum vanderplanki]